MNSCRHRHRAGVPSNEALLKLFARWKQDVAGITIHKITHYRARNEPERHGTWVIQTKAFLESPNVAPDIHVQPQCFIVWSTYMYLPPAPINNFKMSRPGIPKRKPSRLVRAITNPNEYIASMVPQTKDRSANGKRLEDSKLARVIGGVNLDYGLREPDKPRELPSAEEPLADIVVDATVQLKLPPGYRIRSLRRGDYGRGFSKLKTLGQGVSSAAWTERCEYLRSRSDSYVVLVITDFEGTVVCTGTLVLERKFTHGLSLMGRVEELTVGEGQSGLNLGLRMLEGLEGIAEERGCYKCIAAAPEANESFYRQKGFKRTGVELSHHYPMPAAQQKETKEDADEPLLNGHAAE